MHHNIDIDGELQVQSLFLASRDGSNKCCSYPNSFGEVVLINKSVKRPYGRPSRVAQVESWPNSSRVSESI